MDKRQQLDLMDKVQRELEDLNKSQTSVLKKLSQIAAHNITLGAAVLDDKLPDLEDKINATLTTTTELSEAFGEFRNKFLQIIILLLRPTQRPDPRSGYHGQKKAGHPKAAGDGIGIIIYSTT